MLTLINRLGRLFFPPCGNRVWSVDLIWRQMFWLAAPSLWSWARQTFPGSPHASRPACCGRSPEAWWPSPPPRWQIAAPGCRRRRAAGGDPGPSTLQMSEENGRTKCSFRNIIIMIICPTKVNAKTTTITLVCERIWLHYLPSVWQKVQDRWRGWAELTCSPPHRKPQPGHRSPGTAPPQSTAPTARRHNWTTTSQGVRIWQTTSRPLNEGVSLYLQTSLPLEKREDLMTSGAIQE